MDKEILTAQEVAETLGLNADTVAELLQRGELPGRSVAGRWYVSRRQLVEFVEEGGTARKRVTFPVLRPDFKAKVNLADNSWECGHCHTDNDVDHVECAHCHRPRTTPLRGYVPIAGSS